MWLYLVECSTVDRWWFLWVCRPCGKLIFIFSMLVWKSTVSITAKFSSSKNSCPMSKNSRITSSSNKMGHLLTVQRRQSICSITRHQTLSCHHFGLQIVRTSTRSITKYGVSFSSEFTARKSKLWMSWNSVSLRNGNPGPAHYWQRSQQWRRSLRSCVAAKGGHFEHYL